MHKYGTVGYYEDIIADDKFEQKVYLAAIKAETEKAEPDIQFIIKMGNRLSGIVDSIGYNKLIIERLSQCEGVKEFEAKQEGDKVADESNS